MNRAASIELPNSKTLPPNVWLYRNHFLTDIYGRRLDYRDWGVLEIASVAQQVKPFGALLLVGEYDGVSQDLGLAFAAHRQPTAPQTDLVEALTACFLTDKDEPGIERRVEAELPVLHLAKLAITNTDLIFNAGRHINHPLREYGRLLAGNIFSVDNFTVEEKADLAKKARELDRSLEPPVDFYAETATAAFEI